MKSNEAQNQKNMTVSLISALATKEGIITKDIVTTTAKSFATVLNYKGDLRAIIDQTLIAIETRMTEGVSIVNVESKHNQEWVFERDTLPTAYSDAYESQLKSEGWSPEMVESLNRVGKKLLGHLQDPESEGNSWDRRGLVIGNVQSGKTANYMGLIAKAADAGYKFIIVIAGIHNNLRKQTQERVDEGFVGRSSDPDNRINIGVGLTPDYQHPATLTTIYDDFNKNTADKSGWKIDDFSKPIILVIKKNVHTLKALHKWLKDLNTKGSGKIADIPMLMIDDEADNASVNTNKEENDPTRTNEMIRKIVGLFDKSCYVGYTATPFANIFINPDSKNDFDEDELFPRDFIYCLDAPNTYFGPNAVFLDNKNSHKISKPILDCEEYLPFSLKKDDYIHDLPPSLYQAINVFIIARTIRNLRGQSTKHCSMMINVSRFVNVQQSVRNFVNIHVQKVRESVKANYLMPEEISSKNKIMKNLKAAFVDEYSDTEFEWQEIKPALYDTFDVFRVFVINAQSDDTLDYKKYEKDGNGLSAITIGGLSLSRGLTIEGLCVSYMYRNTKMYDTLMQMGRWFGYRPSFQDLCRIYLSQDSINWYAHIAEASEQLREQIIRMRQNNLSPKDFGLYVRSHPDSLLITAKNKMRSGESMTFNLNLTGSIVESTLLPDESSMNSENEALTKEYWSTGFGGNDVEKVSKGWFIRDCKIEIVEQFLTKFKSHKDFVHMKSACVDYLDKISDKHPYCDVFLVSIAKNDENERDFRLGTQFRSWAFKDGIWKAPKHRIASEGDEVVGLTQSEVEDAHFKAKPIKKARLPDMYYRGVRNKPLLMIHVLGLEDKALDKKKAARVPAFGISFPYGDYGVEVPIVANRVYVETMLGSLDSWEEEEE